MLIQHFRDVRRIVGKVVVELQQPSLAAVPCYRRAVEQTGAPEHIRHIAAGQRQRNTLIRRSIGDHLELQFDVETLLDKFGERHLVIVGAIGIVHRHNLECHRVFRNRIAGLIAVVHHLRLAAALIDERVTGNLPVPAAARIRDVAGSDDLGAEDHIRWF